MDAPGDAGLGDPLLFSAELPDSFEGELEPTCDELSDSPASGFEGVFVAPENPGVPMLEVRVAKPFALPAIPEGWGGDTTFVGTE